MQKLIRPIASVFVLAVFLLIAMATGGSSNTTVGSKECKLYVTPIEITAIGVSILFDHKNGTPVAGATGKLFVSRQEIQDTTDCTYLIVDIRTLNITIDATGHYDHTQVGAFNYSNGDLWRVEVNIPAKPGVYEGFRETQVLRGEDHLAIFNFTNPTPL